MPPDRWFIFADEDLMVAKRAMEDKIFNQVCFHAQQGVEKNLKGFLRMKGDPIPKTHHLQELLALCVKHDASLEAYREDCLLLDRYYIPTRYPEALPGSLPDGLPDEQDAKEALDILCRIRDAIKR